MPARYVVVNLEGLLVRSAMTTLDPSNVIRKMDVGESFTVYSTFTMADQTWARISDTAEEFSCLFIDGCMPFAEILARTRTAWMLEVDAFLRDRGYDGVSP